MNITATCTRRPWNKGKLVGQKTPLRLRDIWAIRVRLQLAERTRDLALFDLAIDSKLRACDLTKLRVCDVAHGEHEGTVTELGMFTTAIRTGQGEVLTIPNTMITGAVTKNYSRMVQGPGYLVDTTVTIGYDTPWRQVEAMLQEAARRTPGVLQTPLPRVFQTALSDFYPEYRLVAHAVPEEPKSRAELLTVLHANIQDVFNEHAVQIMSPHYVGDPEQAKWVPKEQWFTPPAKPEAHQERSDD